MTLDQLELFSASPIPVKRRTVQPTPTVKWSKYSARKSCLCDFCVLNAHDMHMAGEPLKKTPLPRKARYRRQDSKNDWLLCSEHANNQRVVDGLGRFKK